MTTAHRDVVIVVRQAGPLPDRLPVTAAHGDLLRGDMLLMFPFRNSSCQVVREMSMRLPMCRSAGAAGSRREARGD